MYLVFTTVLECWLLTAPLAWWWRAGEHHSRMLWFDDSEDPWLKTYLTNLKSNYNFLYQWNQIKFLMVHLYVVCCQTVNWWKGRGAWVNRICHFRLMMWFDKAQRLDFQCLHSNNTIWLTHLATLTLDPLSPIFFFFFPFNWTEISN